MKKRRTSAQRWRDDLAAVCAEKFESVERICAEVIRKHPKGCRWRRGAARRAALHALILSAIFAPKKKAFDSLEMAIHAEEVYCPHRLERR